jgi:glutaredoxin
MPAADHTVTLISRADCHLCTDAAAVLREMNAELGFTYREVDVDSSPVLRAEFSDRVPVILLDGKEHGYWRVEAARLRTALTR